MMAITLDTNIGRRDALFFPGQISIPNMLLTWLRKKAGLHVGSFDLTKKKVIGQKSAQHLLHRTFLLGISEEFHHAAERKGKVAFYTYKHPHIHANNDFISPASAHNKWGINI